MTDKTVSVPQLQLIKELYEFFLGPKACGDFTCSCNKPEICGICELRQRTEQFLTPISVPTESRPTRCPVCDSVERIVHRRVDSTTCNDRWHSRNVPASSSLLPVPISTQVPARPDGQSQSDAATEHSVAREPESVKDGYSPTQNRQGLPVGRQLEKMDAILWLDEHVPLQFTGSSAEPIGETHIDKESMADLMTEFAKDCGAASLPVGESRQQIDKAFEGMSTDEVYQRESARLHGGGGWISVEAKLPPDNSYVMFYVPSEGEYPETGYWRADEKRWESVESGPQNDRIDFDAEQVTHWQPLPLPPGESPCAHKNVIPWPHWKCKDCSDDLGPIISNEPLSEAEIQRGQEIAEKLNLKEGREQKKSHRDWPTVRKRSELVPSVPAEIESRLREYAALCRKAVEAANDYRHAVNEREDTAETEQKFRALYDTIWNHTEDNPTLAHIDRTELADSTRTQEKPSGSK